ncbi:MAG: PEP-CTERM sorting domain-containing protein [Planctomycetota bacterium]|nr:MAG: PEP-CTERM sorting domain-containing protein [Planctomycetota bacterium]
MTTLCARAVQGLVAASLFVSTGLAAQVDFESVPVGTVYGDPVGNVPGDVVLSQDGIDLSVESFFLGTFVGFNQAEVGGRYAGFFSSTPLELDNISVRFDFSDVGFPVTGVSLEFQEFGGADNFAVNDGSVLVLNSLTDLPTDIAPGVTATVDGGVITLTGPVSSFQIGGQELAVDTIVAVPEPATLALLILGGGWLAMRRRLNRPRR